MSFSIVTGFFALFYFSHFFLEVFLNRYDYKWVSAHKDYVPEYLDNIDKENFSRSIRYELDGKNFSLTSMLFNVPLDWFFILFGFDRLDTWLRSYPLPESVRGVFFIFTVISIKTLAFLPFSLYNDFVIEQKYGFNRKTLRMYFSDLGKSFILLILLGLPLIYLILHLMASAGSFWWLWAFGAVFLFQLFIVWIYPIWIAPLFNTFTPLEGELAQHIRSLAEKIRFPLSGIFTMDGSKRSSHSNAFFTGFGKSKRVVLFDTLIRKMSPDQLLAIVAHEMGHYKLGHIRKRLVLSFTALFLFFLFLAYIKPLRILYPSFGFSHASDYAALVIFSLIVSEITFPFQFFMNYLSRRHEFEADKFAVNVTRLPHALVEALKELHKDNLSSPWVHPFYAAYYYSHPLLGERISAIRSIAHYDKD